MKKDRVIQLESTAKRIAELFSNPKREFNYKNDKKSILSLQQSFCKPSLPFIVSGIIVIFYSFI